MLTHSGYFCKRLAVPCWWHIMPVSNPNIRYFSVHDIDCGVGLFLTHWQLRPTIVGGEVIK